MGKGKTAKTGDKALYGSREKLAEESRNKNKADDGDDPMYDEVDRFHNDQDQDFIRLGEKENNNSDDEDEDLAGNTHSVLDLGAGGTSSEEDDDDDDDDDSSSEDDEQKRYSDKKANNYSSSEEDSDSSDDDDDDDKIQEDPRNWGKKKSLYYHGDTADLEIGQEEDDAFLEEEAAQEIQKSRFEEMDEDDFVLSGDDEEGTSSNKADAKNESSNNTQHEELQTIRDTSKLSKKETRKLLDKQYPELLPMVSYFSDIVKDLKDRTQVATTVLMAGDGNAESVGATVKGQQYLLTKAMIQKSIALNSVMYLLLRYASVGDEDATSNIQAHPVMDQLKKFTTLLENLEEGVQKKTRDIDLQLDNLVKAAALMANSGDDDDDDDDSPSDGDDESESAMEVSNEQVEKDIEDDDDDDEASETSNEEVDEGKIAAIAKNYERTLNEARFGLRPNEAKKTSNVSRKRRPHQLDDFGDLEEDETKSSGNMLASTMNTIEQRSQTASRKRRPAPVAEGLDDVDEHDGELGQGLKMMEEELAKAGDDGGDGYADDTGGGDMTDPDADDKGLGFYNKIAAKSKAKKSFKKSLYKVAPKYPRVDGEVAGERSISRDILKNRGLVAHKAKINRNPRVKKREQYRKALIRRKGAVREVRDSEEGHAYGGEQTGIKSKISRSRKLV